LLLAVSGGSDSMAALYYFAEFREQLGIRSLAVAHIDHNLREDSAMDARFVQETADSLNIPCYCVSIKPDQEFVSSHGKEAWARRERYQVLHRIRKDHCPNSSIVTAHTRDDQVETLYLRLGRGTGLRGLQCIKPWREDNVWRPFLEQTRVDLREFLLSRGGTWREDPSNLDLHFSRNILRHKVLPGLSQGYSTNQTDEGTKATSMQSRAEQLAQTCTHITAMAREIWPVVAKDARQVFSESVLYDSQHGFSSPNALDSNDSFQGADLPAWLHLPWMRATVSAVFAHNVLRSIAEENGEDFLLLGMQLFMESLGVQLDGGALKEINRILPTSQKAVQISEDYKLERSGKFWYLLCISAKINAKTQEFCAFKDGIGRKALSWGLNNYLLSVEFRANTPKEVCAEPAEFCTLLQVDSGMCPSFSDFFGQIRVRFRKSGDLFSPPNQPSRSRKLKKYLAGVGIPESLRDQVPLVAIENRILWIPGLAVSGSPDMNKGVQIFLRWTCKS